MSKSSKTVEKLIPVSTDLFYLGMVLPVDLFLSMSLNQADLLFRKKGDCLTADDLKALKAAPEKSIRVRFTEIGDLTLDVRTHQIKAGLQSGDLKSKEVKKAAAGLLASVGTDPGETTADSLVRLTEKVQDIIAAMKNTLSVKAYFRLLESAKKFGDPLDFHNREVSAIAVLILMTMGAKDEQELADIATAGLLHDIGLREGPRPIMEAHCAGKSDFTGGEKVAYMSHPDASLQVIQREKIQVSPEVLRTIEIHHENWDGSGFKGLVGNRISKGARIIRMADELTCRLASATTQEQFDSVLTKISKLASGNKAAIFDPDILLTLSASIDSEKPH